MKGSVLYYGPSQKQDFGFDSAILTLCPKGDAQPPHLATRNTNHESRNAFHSINLDSGCSSTQSFQRVSVEEMAGSQRLK